MHLSFNSIAELDAFLHWAADYRGHVLTEPIVAPQGGVSGSVGGHSVFTAGDGSPADQEAKDLQIGPYDPAFKGSAGDMKPADASAEPAKRKRRTKAEIEADNKAAAEAEQAKTQEPATEAAETPEGTNPFAATETAAETPAATTSDAEAADTTVTPFQHLTRAREFIAKHGMPKYNESFAKAGLDANVMGYSAYQRALHMDALAALEAA